MSQENLQKLIENALLKEYISSNEEVAAIEYTMNRKEAILKKHTSNVYEIKMMKKGGKEVYYTKMDPSNRNHCHMICAVNKEDLEDKIIAYYLGIETTCKLTVRKVLDLAISELSEDTAERHRQRFDKHLSTLNDIMISHLSEDKIRSCLQNIINLGISEKEFNNVTSALNKINDYCAYNRIRCINIRNAISEFRKYKLVGKHVFLNQITVDTELAFNEEEAVTIVKYALDNPSFHNLAIVALIVTGLRSGELLALTPEDVDLARKRIVVTKMEKIHSYKIVDYCKDHSERYVYLNEDAMLVFKLLIEKRSKETTASPYLLISPKAFDGKLHHHALDRRIRKLQHLLGLADKHIIRSCHDCRRTYASIQYQHGIPIKTIQKQLGHTSPQQTWDYIKDIVDTETRLNMLSKGCIL